MFIIHIEHPLNNYDEWKKLFDSDPINRKKSGVVQYRIMRPVENEKIVMIDLEFDDKNNAETALAALREMWSRMQSNVISNPKSNIVEIVEYKKL